MKNIHTLSIKLITIIRVGFLKYVQDLLKLHRYEWLQQLYMWFSGQQTSSVVYQNDAVLDNISNKIYLNVCTANVLVYNYLRIRSRISHSFQIKCILRSTLFTKV